MKNYIFITILLVLIFCSCREDKQIEMTKDTLPDYTSIKLSSNRPNFNVSILLDLSDRINPEKYPNSTMDFYLRDVGYIKSIAQSFEIHLRNKKSIKIHDNIQLFLDPEPSDQNLNEKINNLKISFTKNNATRSLIMQTSKSYDSISRLIYKSAIKDNVYVGSDTWGFFKTKVKDFCIEDNHRNILIILTDGYIYHKDQKRKEGNFTNYLTPEDIRKFKLNSRDWKGRLVEKKFGFIPANDNLQNIEVLVLGINPNKTNPYEEDVLMKYWSDWFDNMKVGRYEIKTTGLPSNMDKIIKNFILNE